ncbi:MAG TPA: SpoIIE family protein phosphatase, partial [Bacteroidia bacterium]|nr:SpoIIE family protein phosphatase [Bacteroidia bacterium]
FVKSIKTLKPDTIAFDDERQCMLLILPIYTDDVLLNKILAFNASGRGSLKVYLNNKVITQTGGFIPENKFETVVNKYTDDVAFTLPQKQNLLQVLFVPINGTNTSRLAVDVGTINWQKKNREQKDFDKLLETSSGYFYLAFAIFLLLIFFFLKNKEYLFFGLYCLFSAFQYLTEYIPQSALIKSVNNFSMLFSLEFLCMFTSLAIVRKNRSYIPLIILTALFGVSLFPSIAFKFNGTINGAEFSLIHFFSVLIFVPLLGFSFAYYWIQGFGQKKWDIMVLTYGMLVGLFFSVIYPSYVGIADGFRAAEKNHVLVDLLSTIGVCIFPVAVALVLAKRYGDNQKQLSQQLVTIKKLGEENVQKEIEKKKILEEQNTQLEEMVSVRTAELSLKNTEITDGLKYAHRIQAALLPDIKIIQKALPQSFVFLKPKDIVSGDFYNFSQKENKIIFTCADCTGHGVSGAFMSMIGNSLLNQIISEKNITDPAQILELLNEGIIHALKQKETETNDGMDVAIITIDTIKSELAFAGANRPLWFVRNNILQTIQPNKLPIGGLQIARNEKFKTHVLQLQNYDTLYLFTDGYADQFGEKTERKIMTKKFKEILLSIQHHSMQEQELHLKNYFMQWKGSLEQVDDVLVVGIRF